MNDETKPLKYWIDLAKWIAHEAHAGQFRRDNTTPYIKHPAAVVKQLEPRLKPIGWLHDVVEDTNVTIEELIDVGFPSYIINGVEDMTHKEGDTNMRYWKNMLTNPDAVTVKIADIKTNLADAPSERQKIKYEKALELFSKAGYSV